jgi:hypothetical protein
VHLRRLTAGGRDLLGSELDATDENLCDGGPSGIFPSVDVATTSDRFAVAWEQEPEIRARRYTFSSGTASPAAPVSNHPVFAHGPQLRFDEGADRYAVSWFYWVGGTRAYEGQTFAGSGAATTGVYTLGDDPAGRFAFDWRLDSLASAWTANLAAPEVRERRFDGGTGIPAAAATVVSAAGVPGDTRVAAARITGRHLVVWTAAPEGGPRGIWARAYSGTGAAVGPPARVDEGGLFGLDAPDVASDGRHFLVVWNDQGDPSFVRARLLDPAGAPLGSEILVDAVDGGSTAAPVVAGGAVGSFLVAWQGTLSGLDETPTKDILVRRVKVVEEIVAGQPAGGLRDHSAGNFRYYAVSVPPQSKRLRVATTFGTFGDLDLWVAPGPLVENPAWVASSQGAGTVESVEIAFPAAGPWLIGIEEEIPYAGAVLTATIEPLLVFADGFESDTTLAW